jgi:amino acid transporter
VPIFLVLYLFWKIVKRSSWRKAADADIMTGKASVDAEESKWPERIPRNIFEKVWFWLV